MALEFPSVSESFKDKDGKEFENISIYSGINRAIFRKGVALTSEALMQKSMGKDPYDEFWDEGGMADIVSYSTFAVGTVNMIAGITMTVKAAQAATQAQQSARLVSILKDNVLSYQRDLTLWQNTYQSQLYTFSGPSGELSQEARKLLDFGKKKIGDAAENLFNAEKAANKAASDTAKKTSMTKVGTAGKWIMGIGGALMIMAAALKGVQIYKYYHRDFTMIPVMIVDESDIVSYTTDENGKQVKLINFNQFAYYEVVKCNRQEIGLHKNVQSGVSDYKSWGCGDAADLNADVGKQWLAMYVNRSAAKGNPILADTLTLKTGKDSEKTPADCNGCLHMFTYANPVKIDDEAYCYRSDKEGMYLYWNGDETAFAASTSTGANTSGGSTSTASAFNAGYLALAGIGGLALGILGTTLVMLQKKKKKEE